MPANDPRDRDSPAIRALMIVSGNAARGNEKSASNRGWYVKKNFLHGSKPDSIQAAPEVTQSNRQSG
jgi:hypothetical protein